MNKYFTKNHFYKHKYFIAHTNCNELTNYQKSEVSKIKWMSLEEASKAIRPYNLERIDLLKDIDKVLNKYSLIS